MIDKKYLIAHTNPKSPISEAYRVLRTNIQFSSVDKPLKTFVVTSSGPSEGKTTTIVNLAITFAQSGNRVLLIDADLRKPRIHKIFNLLSNVGVTNILAMQDQSGYKQYVHSFELENLYILSSGPTPPNPSELLNSCSMKNLLSKVREDYDIILMDAPPVGSVTDAAILSTLVDGTILVAASGQVEIQALKRAKELLEKVNANILGVVLNKLDKKAKGNDYYYYYYYGEDESKMSKKRRKKQRALKK